jgi:hypothetical protein
VVKFRFNLVLTVNGEKNLVDSLHQESVLLLRNCVLGGILLLHCSQQLPVNCRDLFPSGMVDDLLLLNFENSCEELELYIK